MKQDYISTTDEQILRRANLGHLPKPVSNYLEQVGVIDKPLVKSVSLKQRGMFNVNGKKWMAMKAHQTFDIEKAEFVWKARAGVMHVVDQFVNNQGLLKVKLLNLFKSR